MFDLFNPCLLTCEIGTKKPDPKAYELLLQSMNMDSKDVVFIDDNPINSEAARKVGLDAIIFESPNQVRDELQQRGLLKK